MKISNQEEPRWPSSLLRLLAEAARLGNTPRLTRAISRSRLEDDLDRELDFSCRGACSAQKSSYTGGCASSVKYIRIVGSYRWRKISMIEYVEHLRTELHVEVLGNFSNVIVLKYREIDFRRAGPNEDISTCVAFQV